MCLHLKFARTVLIATILPLVTGCPKDQGSAPDALILRESVLDLSCDDMATTTEATYWHRATARGPDPRTQYLSAEDSNAILHHFEQIGYDYEGVQSDLQPVPRVYLAKMPADLSRIEEIRMRKRLFLAAMLPAALQVNEEIREALKRLNAIDACYRSGYTQAQPVQDWLARLGKRYRTLPEASALLHKIGEIPPSLALAQAAFESGWGTSSPARSINSLFGQYAEDSEANDNNPSAPRLAAYDNILDAVRAYAHNLNIHRAYAGFRARRLAMVQHGAPLDSLKLAEKLGAYSSRRNDYIRDIQHMIRRNKLTVLDKADLVEHSDTVARLTDPL